MGRKISVICTRCGESFLKEVKHYNYGVKKGWKPFCSAECQANFNKKRVKCNCATCNRPLEVQQSDYDKSIAKRFYCNSSCFAKLNNLLRSPISQETRKKIGDGIRRHYASNGRLHLAEDRLCLICGKSFRARFDRPNHRCCSRNCYLIYKVGTIPYTKDDVINIVIDIGLKTNKTPQRRDCETKLYHAAVKFFGTWNKAMEACNLKPNHSRYQKTRLKCLDGHISDSISEKTIDDWFFKNGIRHEKNKNYPSSKMHCDFYLLDFDVWVEYFGLCGGGIEEYENAMETKEKIIKDNRFNFISLKPDDLYKNKNISYDDKLKNIFGKYIASRSA
jgi:hypothetical protein